MEPERAIAAWIGVRLGGRVRFVLPTGLAIVRPGIASVVVAIVTGPQ